MAEYTENLNLIKPAQEDQYNVDDFNDNFDKIDDFAGLVPPRALTADKLTTGAKINGVNFKGDTDIITGLGLYSDTNTYDNTNLAYLYDNNLKLRIFQSLQNGNIGHNPLTNPIYWREIQIGSKKHFGEIVTSSLPISDDDTLHLADGSQLSQQDYPEFVSYVAEMHNSHLNKDFSPAIQSATLGTGWNAICSGNERFIAIGDNKVSTSINGIVWTTPQTVSFKGISIAYGNNMFLATGTEEVEGLEVYGCYSSQDGVNWQRLSIDAPGDFYGAGEIIFKDTYFYGMDHQTGELWQFVDGSEWYRLTISEFPNNGQFKIATNNLTTIVLGHKQRYNGTNCYISTNNLESWSSSTPDELQGYQWSAITYDGSNFIAVSTNGYVSTSIDGTTWTTPTLNTNLGNNNWADSVYGNSMVVVISKTGYISTKEAMPKLFTTEAEWQQTYTTYGECGKYVYNAQANTVRIPLYNSYLTNTTNPDNLGNLTPASIPNIKGVIPASEKLYKRGTTVSDYGAFRDYAENVVSGQSDNTHFDNDLWDFDASRSNSIYSDLATTVNTQSIKQLIYIVVKV